MTMRRLGIICGGLLAFWQFCAVAASAGGGTSSPDRRYLALGMTEVSDAWRGQHARDENFLYVLDSATGRIEVCSDVEAVCRSLAGSQRDAQGVTIGRFAGVKIGRATKAWKAAK